MSLTPTQLSELQTIVEALRVEFPSSDDVLWEAAIRIQKGGLGPVTGPGGQPAFDTAVADIVLEAEQISTVQGRQGGLGNSVAQATFNVVPVEDNLPPGTVGSVIYLDVAPNTYLSTDVVELTPAGPNSVVLSEIGTQVARTVAAAAGGLEINNLSTGAGFERALTVSDLGGGAVPGGVDTNVQFNDAGAFGGSANLTWDDNTFAITNTTSSAPALQLNVGNNPSAAFQIDTTLSTNYIAFRMNDQTGANFFLWRHDYGLSTPNHELTLESSQFGTIMEIENEGNMYLGGQEGTAILQLLLTGTSRVLVENVPLYLEERAAAGAAVASEGQLWVRNDVPNVLMFTDDAGTDFEISSGVLPTSSAEGEILVGDGSGGWREGFGVLMQATAGPPAADEGYITLSSTASVDVRRSQIFMESQASQSVAFFFETAATDGFYQRIVGNGADRIAWGREVASVDTDMFSIREDVSIRVEAGANFFLAERAAAAANIATYGQLWVNSADDSLNYTTEAGVNFDLTDTGAPGGADTNVQFNNAGAFGGSADFTWDNTNGILTLNQIGASTESIRINNIDPSAPVIVMGGVGSASTNWDIFRSIDNGGTNYWRLTDDHSLSSANHRLQMEHSTLSSSFFQFEAGGDGYLFGQNAARSLSVVDIDTNPTDIRIGDQVTFRFDEKAAAGTPVANFGELWVRNDTPNTLMFTDDAGSNVTLSIPFTATEAGLAPLSGGGTVNFLRADGTWAVPPGGVANPMTADLDGDGFDLDDMGVMFMREQATADADVTGQGQLWVETRPFAQRLMYTAENGADFIVAGLPDSDVAVGSNLIAGTSFVAVANIGNVTDTVYMLLINVEVTAPAADDMLIQLTVNTGSRFKGVLTYAGQSITAGSSEIESTTGEVITNNVLVPTSGNATPDGTYVSIQGVLYADSVAQTVSLRCAKNADTGADGFAVRAVIKALPCSDP